MERIEITPGAAGAMMNLLGGARVMHRCDDMKPWAKPFYKSKAWRDCREAYFVYRHGLCELCNKPGEEVHHKVFLTPENISDPNVTLNWDNLQVLCKTCHNAVHEKAYEMHRQKRIKNTSVSNGLCFDEDGNLIEKKNVYIVWGAPASGKTTYVLEHKGKHDIVIDLDHIMAALSLSEPKTRNEDALPFALEVQNLLYDLIARRKYYFEAAWIIACLPKKEERKTLAKRLRAELIHIDTPKEVCLARARADDERKDKQTQYKIIEKYFEQLEL